MTRDIELSFHINQNICKPFLDYNSLRIMFQRKKIIYHNFRLLFINILKKQKSINTKQNNKKNVVPHINSSRHWPPSRIEQRKADTSAAWLVSTDVNSYYFNFLQTQISVTRWSLVIICRNSCREEHLSQPFCLHNREDDSRCTLQQSQLTFEVIRNSIIIIRKSDCQA